jgi:hypothetical protein
MRLPSAHREGKHFYKYVAFTTMILHICSLETFWNRNVAGVGRGERSRGLRP